MLNLMPRTAAASSFDDYASNQVYLYLKGNKSMKAGSATMINDVIYEGGRNGLEDTHTQDMETLTSATDGSATADLALSHVTLRRRRQGKQPSTRIRHGRPPSAEAVWINTSTTTQRRIVIAFTRTPRS